MPGDIAQQTPPFAHHLQQTAASHVVMLSNLEVLGQFLDTLGQDSYLGTRPAGIVLVCLHALNGGSLLFLCYHVQAFYQMAVSKASRAT